MLYGTEAPSMEILTHSNNPLMQGNGFHQLGDDVPIYSSSPKYLSGLGVVRIVPARQIFTVPEIPKIPSVPVTPRFPRLFPSPPPSLDSTPLKRTRPLFPSSSPSDSTPLIRRTRPSYLSGADERLSGLGSWFTKKVVPAVKKTVRKVALVQVSAISGAASGFVTSGFNPYGAIAGAVAGGTKGVVDASKSSSPTLTFRNVYQPAAYGAGAGVAVGAGSWIGTQAQQAALAKSGEAAAAESLGYSVPGGVSSGGASSLGFFGAVGSGVKNAAAYLGAAFLPSVFGKPPPQPGESPGGPVDESQLPGGVPYYIPGFNPAAPTSEAMLPSSGSGGDASAPPASPDYSQGLPAAPGGIMSHPVLLAGAGLLTFMVIRMKRGKRR